MGCLLVSHRKMVIFKWFIFLPPEGVIGSLSVSHREIRKKRGSRNDE